MKEKVLETIKRVWLQQGVSAYLTYYNFSYTISYRRKINLLGQCIIKGKIEKSILRRSGLDEKALIITIKPKKITLEL